MRHDRVLGSSRLLQCGAIAVLALSATPGCNSATTAPQKLSYSCGPSGCPSNENVITDFQNAFINLDSAAVARLLAPGFVFRFQLQDAQNGEPDSLTRAAFLGAIGNLFDQNPHAILQPAMRISLALSIVSKDDDNRIGHLGWMKYTLNTALTLTFQDGNQTQVSSPGTFYFTTGGAGWQLAEWQDQPGSTGRPVHLEGTDRLAKVRTASWGSVLRAYSLAVMPGQS
jgi:hypothetical protein